MKQFERPSFIMVMSAMAEVYKREISESMVEIYWNIFERFEFEEFKKAVSRVMMSSEYFPAPAIILDELTGTEEDHAIRAWEQVKTAMRCHGAYETILFEDGKIGAILESFGGWPQFCMLKESEIDSFKRSEFLRLYRALAPREPRELPGLFDIHNAVHITGYKRDPKVFPVPGKQRLLQG